MCRDIVIFGAGGFGREILVALEEQNEKNQTYNILGFVDDNPKILHQKVNGYPVLGDSDFLLQYHDPICVLICLGEPQLKRKIYEKISPNKNITFPNFICDDVSYNNNNNNNNRLLTKGKGNIVQYKSVLTTNVSVGDFVHINIGCTISHDVEIGDFTTISPGCHLLGNVKVGQGVFIGTGVSVRDEIVLGNHSVIGMGSIVTKDIKEQVLAFGSPCQEIRPINLEERIFT